MLESNTTPSPFTLPKLGNETTVSSLEALSACILSKANLKQHENEESMTTPITSTSTITTTNAKGNSAQRVGRWTLDEKILFLYGLKKYGKGRWKKMSTFLPDRSLVQIKSHAQKVLKRLSEGEHVFRRLEENGARLHVLLANFNETVDPMTVVSDDVSDPVPNPSTDRRKRRKIVETTNSFSVLDGREHIIAASALCQLAGPKQSGDKLFDPTTSTTTSSSNRSNQSVMAIPTFLPTGTTANSLQAIGTNPHIWNMPYGGLPL